MGNAVWINPKPKRAYDFVAINTTDFFFISVHLSQKQHSFFVLDFFRIYGYVYELCFLIVR